MTVVLDANVIVAQVVEVDWSDRAQARFSDWFRTGAVLVAPALWQYEVTTALRKLSVLTELSHDEADAILEKVYSLGIETVAPSPELQRSALAWAGRLGVMATYDATYLALAERLHAPFWTGDSRLARSARAAGAKWVHDILAEGEAELEELDAPAD